MNPETRNEIENSLKVIDEKIVKKEDNIRGGLYMFGVGLVGTAYGVLTKSDSSVISGLLVSSGSLFFRLINNMSLDDLRFQQYTYRYALKFDNVSEHHSDSRDHYRGKHFKK